MAEIRSTIDLMMERTAGMALSDEEREKLHWEDLEKRARGLQIRLTSTPDAAQEILASLDEASDEDRRMLQELLWDKLVEGLPADASGLKLVNVLERLPQAQAHQKDLAELREVLRSSQKDQSQDRHKILTREKKRLAQFGISGSAVIPKITEDMIAEEGHGDRLKDLKQRLRGEGR